MRINVVGTSGSGKSTFSKRLAERLNVPYIRLDELHWKPDWTASTGKELFANLEKKLTPDGWVLDGNYTRTIPVKWKRVQLVIYLDLPFALVLYRIIKRSLYRGIRREELWHGNRESVWRHLFTRDSMILWTIKTFHANRRQFEADFKNPDYSHIKFVTLRSGREVEDFIANALALPGALMDNHLTDSPE